MGRGRVREEFSSIYVKIRKEKKKEEEGREKGQERRKNRKKKSKGLGYKNFQRETL